MDSVRADDPLCLNRVSSHDGATLCDAGHRCVPLQLDAAFFRAFDHFLMQNGSPHTHAAFAGEFCCRRSSAIDKAHAPKNLPVAGLYVDAKFAKRRKRAGQEPFAARFVDRRLRAIGNDY